MFDIGFSELVLIAVVALIVIGPQRLPRVARTAGHLLGRMQRYVSDVKADIAREMELEELRKVQSSMEEAARTMRDSVDQGMNEAQKELGGLESLAHEADMGDIGESPHEADAQSPQRELPLEPEAPSRTASQA